MHKVKMTSASAAIGSQRRGATGVLNQEVWTRNTTAPQPSLAKGAGARPVSFVRSGLPLPAWYCAIIPGWDSSADIKCRVTPSSPLYSSTSALLVPATQRTTLGDRAFPVAAARAWNALPDSVRTSSSYMALRRQLQSLLFKASFGDDRTWMLHLYCNCECVINFVQCPCSIILR